MRFSLRLLALLIAAIVIAPSTMHAANKSNHYKAVKQKHKAKKVKHRKAKKHR